MLSFSGEKVESDHKARESDSTNMLDKEKSVNASRERSKSENGFVDLKRIGCQVKDPSMRKRARTVGGSDLRLSLVLPTDCKVTR